MIDSYFGKIFDNTLPSTSQESTFRSPLHLEENWFHFTITFEYLMEDCMSYKNKQQTDYPNKIMHNYKCCICREKCYKDWSNS